MYESGGTWQQRTSFRNRGDAIQVRQPDTSFFQGFAYGDRPDGLSFNVDGPGTGRRKVFFFTCGDYATNLGSDGGQTYFSDSTITGTIGETPGAPNNIGNAFFINQVQAGTFDYTNPDDFCDATTPVTLSFFSTMPGIHPGDVEFHWQTATELGNLGFYLYGQSDAGEWVRINQTLIPSKLGDSVQTQDYRYTISHSQSRVFAISDVDVFGRETLHGPFEINTQHGVSHRELQVTDWKSIQKEKQTKQQIRRMKRKTLIRQQLEKKRLLDNQN